ncbi:MobV family relaxase [Vreelandella massiliensis]|uniref:MobV family relaxase n=1 Tax=Vreelandella massiliensis TaxID=1816686 RepID=UPI00096A7437|nr:MobV family relaxase [Halomonas massiliensis]
MAAQYPAIIRAIKLNSFATLGSSLAHNYRTMSVPHADKSRTHLNEDWKDASTPSAIKAAIKQRIKLADKVHPKAVVALEYLVSAPHEAFEEQGGPVAWRAYFQDALKWLEQRHGADNVVAANIQLDERTPHLVVYVCPLVHYAEKTRRRWVMGGKDPVTGRQNREMREFVEPAHIKLSSNFFMGGRDKLTRLQSNFAEQVGKKHGLRRGVERSALTHIDLKKYHDALMKGVQQRLNIPADLLKPKSNMLGIRSESPEDLAARVTEALQSQVEGLMAQLATAKIDRQRAWEWEQTAAQAQEELKAEKDAHQTTKKTMEGLVGGLTDDQLQKVSEFRQGILRKRKEAKQQREAEEKARIEKQQRDREAAMITRLQQLSPEVLATLPDEDRLPLWRFLTKRRDLTELQDKFFDSELFHTNGAVIRTPEEAPAQASSAPKPGPETPDWLKPSGNPGPSM